jgi:hypothetical protein
MLLRNTNFRAADAVFDAVRTDDDFCEARLTRLVSIAQQLVVNCIGETVLESPDPTDND